MSDYDAFAPFYDALTGDVDYPRRGLYYGDLLRQSGVQEGIVLDLACGTGRLTVELAKQGYDMIGVDSSCRMLSKARENGEGQNILWLCQEMQELDLYGTIRGAVCALDSLNHLTREEDVCRVLERVSLFLEPGGIFLFDVNTIYKHRHVLGNQCFVYELEEVFAVWQNQLEGDRVDIFLDFFQPEGEFYRRTSEEFSEQAYTEEQLTRWLDGAGFAVEHRYEELTLQEPKETTQRVVYAARKR